MSAATLTAALRVEFEQDSNIVKDSCFVFSGQSIGRIFTAAKATETIKGRYDSIRKF